MYSYVKKRFVLAPFLASWCLYFVLFASSGYTSSRETLTIAVIYQLVFVLMVCLPISFPGISKLEAPRPIKRGEVQIITAGLIIAALSVISLYTDKLTQGIDYTNGVCYARFEMTRLGEEREGISSVFSAIGHLFGYVYFVPPSIVIIRNVSRKYIWIIVLLSFFIMMTQSYVMATRTPMLLFGGFLCTAACIRIALEEKIYRPKLIDAFGVIIMCLTVFLFIAEVFSCRATASNLQMADYTEDFVSHLGGKRTADEPDSTLDRSSKMNEALTETPDGSSSSFVSNLVALWNITVLYGTHSAFTFATILDLPPQASYMTLGGPLWLLEKVGLKFSSESLSPEIQGRFPSMPGSLFSDFGLLGLISGGLLMGYLIRLCLIFMSNFGGSVVFIGLFASLGCIASLSPIIIASNITVFPFVLFSFFALPIIAGLIRAVIGLLRR